MTMFNGFELPSTRQFIQQAADALLASQSVVITVPDSTNIQRLHEQLTGQLLHQHVRLPLVSPPPDVEHLVSFFIQAIRMEWADTRAPMTVANLMSQPKLPPILSLKLPDNLSPATTARWLDFIKQWQRTAEILVNEGELPPALCVLARGRTLPQLPTSNDHMQVMWWWGFPAMLEMQLLCREKRDNDSVVAMWREFVLPSLAGNDLGILQALWRLPDDIDEVMAILQNYATKRGWTPDLITELDAITLVRTASNNIPTAPPPELVPLWQRGIISWTYENGLELHSAALALVNERDTLQHRVWRGQANLLLPTIDRFRLAVCDHLTANYGADWPIKWDPPLTDAHREAAEENPRSSELGHMAHLLHNAPELKADRRYAGPMRLARDIRNVLAHYTPVEYERFADLMREIDALGV
jgi:hypothetical protein